MRQKMVSRGSAPADIGRSSHASVTVGLVGADAFARRIIDLARQLEHPTLRLLPATYASVAAIPDGVEKVLGHVDSLLFAGPLPYDHAAAALEIEVPCIVVPTGGPAVAGVIARALAGGMMDPKRLSIDSVTEAELAESYDELELETDGVLVLPYASDLEPQDFIEFHERAFDAGRTTGAITTVPSVFQALTERGIPTLRMVPASLTLRQSLTTAILAGSGSRLEEAQPAVLLVRVAAGALPSRLSYAQYWFQELQLSLHRELLVLARRLDAIVIGAEERGYLVLTTVGALRTLSDDLTSAAFFTAVSRAVGYELEIGIGLGPSVIAAATNAYRAIQESTPGDGALLFGPDGLRLRLGAASAGKGDRTPPRAGRELETLRVLVAGMDTDEAGRYVVDAERAAGVLGVTMRTARRSLQNLVEAGLAWPLPPSREKRVGRPSMMFQLLDGRTGVTATRQAGPAGPPASA